MDDMSLPCLGELAGAVGTRKFGVMRFHRPCILFFLYLSSMRSSLDLPRGFPPFLLARCFNHLQGAALLLGSRLLLVALANEAPRVDDGVCIVVKHLLTQFLQVRIQLEPRPTGGERSNEDIGPIAGQVIVLCVLEDHLQHIVCAETDVLHLICVIFGNVEQLVRVCTLFNLGQILALAEFTPEAVQHQFCRRLQSRIFLHILQGDALFLFVLLDALLLLGRCLAPSWPTGRFLFQLEPSVYVIIIRGAPLLPLITYLIKKSIVN